MEIELSERDVRQKKVTRATFALKQRWKLSRWRRCRECVRGHSSDVHRRPCTSFSFGHVFSALGCIHPFDMFAMQDDRHRRLCRASWTSECGRDGRGGPQSENRDASSTLYSRARTHARVHTATSMTRDTFYIYGTSVARASSSRSSIVFRCFPRDTLYPGTCKFKFGAILTKMTILSRSWGNRVWRQKVFHVVKFSLTTCQRVDSMTENFVSKKKTELNLFMYLIGIYATKVQ